MRSAETGSATTTRRSRHHCDSARRNRHPPRLPPDCASDLRTGLAPGRSSKLVRAAAPYWSANRSPPSQLPALVEPPSPLASIEKVGFDSQTNTVLLRGPASKIVPAQALF